MAPPATVEGLDRMPRDLRRLAVGAIVVSLVIGLASGLLFFAAFRFRLDWFAQPALAISGGEATAAGLRWGGVLDLVGYYLATVVLAYALWRHLRSRNATVADLSFLGALAYAAAGGAGAAVLAMVAPMLIEQYAESSSEVWRAQFAFLLEAVGRGVWQLFDGIALSGWWLGIGMLLRADQLGVARLSFTLAGVGIVGVVFNVLGFATLRDATLLLIFALWTAWWIWLLVLLRRGSS
jgi:hypothetical protein